jgi:tetratricopeptide (TPR) repeat protein
LPKSYSKASKRGLVAPVTIPASVAHRRLGQLLIVSAGWLAGSITAAVLVKPYGWWLALCIFSAICALLVSVRLAIEVLDRRLAAAEVRRGVVRPSQNADVQLNSGVALYEKGDLETALNVFRTVALQGAPSARAAAWLNAGLISEDLGRPLEAESAWNESLASSYGLTASEASQLSNAEFLVLASLSTARYVTESEMQAETALDRKQLREAITSLADRNLIEAASINFVRRFRLIGDQRRTDWRRR